MRQDVDHLPAVQQRELERVTRILRDEFGAAISGATQPWKKNGKILKIILFGSYSRDDWVDEPQNGYLSDFDLLIIASHEDLTDIADYWYVAQDKILHDPAIGRQVNIIVHTLQDVNQSLQRGEYFWTDIVRDGILLYELPNHPLAAPRALDAADAFQMAKGYFDKWIPSIAEWMEMAAGAMAKGPTGDWPNNAAFLLHQAAERSYAGFLLVRTLYLPRSHNIKFLRSIAEDMEPRLIAAWPRDTKLDRRRFELLKRAYVEARYSSHYTISADDLEWLSTCVSRLSKIVGELASEWLEELRRKAG